MFLGIFFCLRSAVSFDFELAPEHVLNRNGINLFFVAHYFRFCCLTISGDFTNIFIGIYFYYTLLYSTMGC